MVRGCEESDRDRRQIRPDTFGSCWATCVKGAVRRYGEVYNKVIKAEWMNGTERERERRMNGWTFESVQPHLHLSELHRSQCTRNPRNSRAPAEPKMSKCAYLLFRP